MSKIRRGGRSHSDGSEPLSAGRVEYLEAARARARNKNIRPRSAAMILSGEVSGKIDRVCCGAVKIFMGNKSSPLCTFLQIWWDLR